MYQQHIAKMFDKMCEAKAAELISKNKNNICKISGSMDWAATLADVTTLMFGYVWNAAAGATEVFLFFYLQCSAFVVAN